MLGIEAFYTTPPVNLNAKYILFDIPSMVYSTLLYGHFTVPATMDFYNNQEDNTIISSRNRSGTQVKHLFHTQNVQ